MSPANTLPAWGRRARGWAWLLVPLLVGCESEAERAQVRKAKAAATFSELRQCVLGAPLAKKETTASRARRVTLADNPGWPSRCGEHLAAAYKAALAGPELHEFRTELDSRFHCDTTCAFDDVGQQFASLEDAAALGPIPTSSGDAPTATPPFRVAPPALAKGKRLEAIQHVTGPVDYLYRKTTGPFAACRFASDGGYACTDHEVAAARFASTAQSAILEISTEKRQLYVDAASGEELGPDEASATPLALFAGHGGELEVRLRPTSGRKGRVTSLKLPTGATVFGLLDHDVLWSVGKPKPLFRSREVGGDGQLGASESLPLPAALDHLHQSCSAEGTQALLLGALRNRALIYRYGRTAWRIHPLRDISPTDAPRAPDKRTPSVAKNFGVIDLLKNSEMKQDAPWGSGEPQGTNLFDLERKHRLANGGAARTAVSRPKLRPVHPKTRAAGVLRDVVSCSSGGVSLLQRLPGGPTGNEVLSITSCTQANCKTKEVTLPLAVQAWWGAISDGKNLSALYRAEQNHVLYLWQGPVNAPKNGTRTAISDDPNRGGIQAKNLATMPIGTGLRILFDSKGALRSWVLRPDGDLKAESPPVLPGGSNPSD